MNAAPVMTCRPGCAACCTAPSISSPIPGMPQGKPAGMPCVQLDAQGRCKIFGQPTRPAVCSQLQASAEMCGPQDDGGQFARAYLMRLEVLTAPGSPSLRAKRGNPASAVNLAPTPEPSPQLDCRVPPRRFAPRG